MKTLKSLLMLCAGLSFCACSSDNEPQFPEGNGTVEVRIVPPTVATRMTGAATTVTKITGTYTVKLTDGGVEKDPTSNSDGVYTFTQIANPEKVTVVLNGGAKSFSTVTINSKESPNMQDVAANTPAYGETSIFTPVSENGKVTKYTASVSMAIPVARLEVGSISFTTNDTKFQELTVAGVYMDNLRTVGGEYATKVEDEKVVGYFTEAQSPAIKDYYFTAGSPAVNYGADADEIAYILGDITSGDFVAAENPLTVLPSTDNVYAYNFYGATPGTTYSEKYAGNPKFKICFSESQLTTEGTAIPRYAMITNYKKAKETEPETYENIVLENGKIYKITNVQLVDKNIVMDESGDEVTFNVEVTVEEAAWTIETISADWAQ